jgi:hypothetical protein
MIMIISIVANIVITIVIIRATASSSQPSPRHRHHHHHIHRHRHNHHQLHQGYKSHGQHHHNTTLVFAKITIATSIISIIAMMIAMIIATIAMTSASLSPPSTYMASFFFYYACETAAHCPHGGIPRRPTNCKGFTNQGKCQNVDATILFRSWTWMSAQASIPMSLVSVWDSVCISRRRRYTQLPLPT